jgi:hypothetical protein
MEIKMLLGLHFASVTTQYCMFSAISSIVQKLFQKINMDFKEDVKLSDSQMKI